MSGKGSISRMSDECLMTLETVFLFYIDCQAVIQKFTLAGKTLDALKQMHLVRPDTGSATWVRARNPARLLSALSFQKGLSYNLQIENPSRLATQKGIVKTGSSIWLWLMSLLHEFSKNQCYLLDVMKALWMVKGSTIVSFLKHYLYSLSSSSISPLPGAVYLLWLGQYIFSEIMGLEVLS